MLASSSGNLELVRLFLRNSAEVNMTDVNGRTALFYAAFYGHVSICKELLSKGASVDIQDIKGATPMPEAVKPDKVQILQLLLEHKASTKYFVFFLMTKEKEKN